MKNKYFGGKMEININNRTRIKKLIVFEINCKLNEGFENKNRRQVNYSAGADIGI